MKNLSYALIVCALGSSFSSEAAAPTSKNKSPSKIVPTPRDSAEDYKKIMAAYPWTLPESTEAKALRTLGVEIDFNAPYLANPSTWFEISAGSAAELKAGVEKTEREILGQAAKLLATNSLGIKKILLHLGTAEMQILGHTWLLPISRRDTEFTTRFLRNMQAVRDQANRRTDGLWVIPSHIGQAGSVFSPERFLPTLEIFGRDYYPAIRTALQANPGVVTSIILETSGDSVAPFELFNSTGQLVINIDLNNPGVNPSLQTDLPKYLGLISALPEVLRRTLPIRGGIENIVGHGNNQPRLSYRYAGALAGLAALQQESALLLQKKSNVKIIRMHFCPAVPAFSRDPEAKLCEAKIDGNELKLPVGTNPSRDDELFLGKSATIKTVEEIRTDLRKTLNAN